MIFSLNINHLFDFMLLLALCAGIGFVPVMLLWQSITDFKRRKRRVQQQIKHFKNL